MIRYMKRVAQVVVLTTVLVFSGLIVVSTDFMTENAEALTHIDYEYHVTKYYCDAQHSRGYYRYLDYF